MPSIVSDVQKCPIFSASREVLACSIESAPASAKRKVNIGCQFFQSEANWLRFITLSVLLTETKKYILWDARLETDAIQISLLDENEVQGDTLVLAWSVHNPILF